MSDLQQENGGKTKKQRNKKTPEQRKKSAKRALIGVGVFLLVFGIFLASVATANVVTVKAVVEQAGSVEKVEYTSHAQLVPQKDDDGHYSFTADRDLKVVQITDVHIGGGSFSARKDLWALNAVATMVRAEQPDLVIITGDIAFPVPYSSGSFNNLNATNIFAIMMENLGVYWTFAFGNHDTEIYSMYSREQICEYYENANYQYCLFQRGFASEDDGYGNNIIKVKNSQGIITQALVLLDSHAYLPEDKMGIAWKYDNLHQGQVDWYAQQMDALVAQNVANGGTDAPIKNLTFFHIPLVEYRDAWAQLMENSPNVEKNVDNQTMSGVNDTDDIKYFYGIMNESDSVKNGVRNYGVCCGYGQDELFEQGLTHGLQGVFCGHDHLNNFSIEYKGIRLTYGMSIDYLAYFGIYKQHAQRGCTVITISTDGSFACTPKNYYSNYNVSYEAN